MNNPNAEVQVGVGVLRIRGKTGAEKTNQRAVLEQMISNRADIQTTLGFLESVAFNLLTTTQKTEALRAGLELSLQNDELALKALIYLGKRILDE